METIATTYIICGVLYIIACVMDGQDVKPLWKKWVSRRLEKSANYFFPIKYVTETKYKYVPINTPSPFEHCDYNHLTFNAEKNQCNAPYHRNRHARCALVCGIQEGGRSAASDKGKEKPLRPRHLLKDSERRICHGRGRQENALPEHPYPRMGVCRKEKGVI